MNASLLFRITEYERRRSGMKDPPLQSEPAKSSVATDSNPLRSQSARRLEVVLCWILQALGT